MVVGRGYMIRSYFTFVEHRYIVWKWREARIVSWQDRYALMLNGDKSKECASDKVCMCLCECVNVCMCECVNVCICVGRGE